MIEAFGFCQLAGGSKGNSSFLKLPSFNLLIDAGIHEKRLRKDLDDLALTLDAIDAIFITHEHQDHISGLKSIYKKIQPPLYCNLETAQAIYRSLKQSFPFHIFTTNEPFTLKGISILPLSIPHDAVDPVGYRIRSDSLNIAVFSDLGAVTETLIEELKGVNYLIIEANHERRLVEESQRSLIYKERVLSRFGHLSNEEAKELIESIESPALKKIILTHLSEECNKVAIVKDYFAKWDILIADQKQKTAFIPFEALSVTC